MEELTVTQRYGSKTKDTILELDQDINTDVLLEWYIKVRVNEIINLRFLKEIIEINNEQSINDICEIIKQNMSDTEYELYDKYLKIFLKILFKKINGSEIEDDRNIQIQKDVLKGKWKESLNEFYFDNILDTKDFFVKLCKNKEENRIISNFLDTIKNEELTKIKKKMSDYILKNLVYISANGNNKIVLNSDNKKMVIFNNAIIPYEIFEKYITLLEQIIDNTMRSVYSIFQYKGIITDTYGNHYSVDFENPHILGLNATLNPDSISTNYTEEQIDKIIGENKKNVLYAENIKEQKLNIIYFELERLNDLFEQYDKITKKSERIINIEESIKLINLISKHLNEIDLNTSSIIDKFNYRKFIEHIAYGRRLLSHRIVKEGVFNSKSRSSSKKDYFLGKEINESGNEISFEGLGYFGLADLYIRQELFRMNEYMQNPSLAQPDITTGVNFFKVLDKMLAIKDFEYTIEPQRLFVVDSQEQNGDSIICEVRYGNEDLLFYLAKNNGNQKDNNNDNNNDNNIFKVFSVQNAEETTIVRYNPSNAIYKNTIKAERCDTLVGLALKDSDKPASDIIIQKYTEFKRIDLTPKEIIEKIKANKIGFKFASSVEIKDYSKKAVSSTTTSLDVKLNNLRFTSVVNIIEWLNNISKEELEKFLGTAKINEYEQAKISSELRKLIRAYENKIIEQIEKDTTSHPVINSHKRNNDQNSKRIRVTDYILEILEQNDAILHFLIVEKENIGQLYRIICQTLPDVKTRLFQAIIIMSNKENDIKNLCTNLNMTKEEVFILLKRMNVILYTSIQLDKFEKAKGGKVSLDFLEKHKYRLIYQYFPDQLKRIKYCYQLLNIVEANRVEFNMKDEIALTYFVLDIYSKILFEINIILENINNYNSNNIDIIDEIVGVNFSGAMVENYNFHYDKLEIKSQLEKYKSQIEEIILNIQSQLPSNSIEIEEINQYEITSEINSFKK